MEIGNLMEFQGEEGGMGSGNDANDNIILIIKDKNNIVIIFLSKCYICFEVCLIVKLFFHYL